MTDDEFKRLATTFGFAPSRPLREMLEAAVRREREACAQLCQTYDDDGGSGEAWGPRFATAIRARSKE